MKNKSGKEIGKELTGSIEQHAVPHGKLRVFRKKRKHHSLKNGASQNNLEFKLELLPEPAGLSRLQLQ